MKEFYVIDFDEKYFDKELRNHVNTGKRIYYVSSQAKDVDPFDINYAKFFPTIRAAKHAMQYAPCHNSKIYKVELHVTIKEQIE